jgi:voltage-gated potassium channel
VRLHPEAREQALRRVEQSTAWPMLVLALAIIPLILIPMLVHLSPRAERLVTAADWLIWAAFATEYIVRFTLAPRKRLFFRHNLIDFVVVAVPFAQPLRLLRSVRVLRVLRATRVMAVAGKGAKEGRSLLSRENFSYALLVILLAIAGGAALVLSVEKLAPGANIKSFPDALWWAISTIATVGYGDRYPVTAEGRAIASVLMILGIGLVGLIAATLASFFVEEHGNAELAEVNERLKRIEAALLEIKAADVQASSPDELVAAGEATRR